MLSSPQGKLPRLWAWQMQRTQLLHEVHLVCVCVRAFEGLVAFATCFWVLMPVGVAGASGWARGGGCLLDVLVWLAGARVISRRR
jgi:hypothetical protein